jgi:hypothetical protein
VGFGGLLWKNSGLWWPSLEKYTLLWLDLALQQHIFCKTYWPWLWFYLVVALISMIAIVLSYRLTSLCFAQVLTPLRFASLRVLSYLLAHFVRYLGVYYNCIPNPCSLAHYSCCTLMFARSCIYPISPLIALFGLLARSCLTLVALMLETSVHTQSRVCVMNGPKGPSCVCVMNGPKGPSCV